MAEEDTVCQLHNAISDVSALLAQCMSEVNMNYNGETAMTHALNKCSNDVIPKAVMKHPHFDPHARNRHERTALFEAAKLGYDDIVTSLLDMGANVDAADRQGLTPLSICAWYNRNTTAGILLSHGADVNMRDKSGNTPLHYASSKGAKEVVSVLLRHGCDVSFANQEGQTAVMMSLPSAYSIQVEHQPLSRTFSIFSHLLQAGCKVETTAGQSTSLHEKVDRNDLAGACLLMHYCPSLVDHQDEQGMTALERALTREDGYEMALCLLQYGASPSHLLPSGSAITNNHSWNNRFLSLVSKSLSSLHESSHGGAVNAHVFHRLRFLQALLASSFFTPTSIGRLVSLGLITSDCMKLVCTALEQVRMEAVYTDDVDESESVTPTHNATTDTNASTDSITEVLSSTTTITTNGSSSSIADFYNQEAAELVCSALWKSQSLQFQCRLFFRRLLGFPLHEKLLQLPLPSNVQDDISLGVNMNTSSPLHVVQMHVAITENDVNRVRELLEAGTDVNYPFMENLPLTRALHLQPSHNDYSQQGVVPIGDNYTCRLCGGRVGTGYNDVGVIVADALTVSMTKDATTAADHNSLRLSGDDVIELLLRHKASLTLKDPLGDTAVDVAVQRGICVLQRLLTAVVTVTRSTGRDKSVLSQLDIGQSRRSVSHVITGTGFTGTARRSRCSPLEMAVLKGDRNTLKQLLYWAATDLVETGVIREFRNCSSENSCTTLEQEPGDFHRNVAEGTNDENKTILRDSAGSVTDCDKKKVFEVTDVEKTAMTDAPNSRESVTHSKNESHASSDVEERVTAAEEPCMKGRSVSMLATWVGSTGVTALHCAAVAGLPVLTEALLKSGSEVNRMDKLGKTARQVAENQGAEYTECHHLLFTPSSNFWKGFLRTWPKIQPRPYLSHMLLRHNDRSDEGHRDMQSNKDGPCVQKIACVANMTGKIPTGVTRDNVQPGVAETTDNTQEEAGKPYPSDVRNASNDHATGNRPIIRHLPHVNYQLTGDILQRHSAHAHDMPVFQGKK